MYIYIYMYIYKFIYIYIYIYIYEFIYIQSYNIYNSIHFITKIINIIHKQKTDLYQNSKEIKRSYSVLRFSCKHALQYLVTN